MIMVQRMIPRAGKIRMNRQTPDYFMNSLPETCSVRFRSPSASGLPVGKSRSLSFWLATVLLAFVPPAPLHAQSDYATPYTFTTLAGSAGYGILGCRYCRSRATQTG